MVLNSNSYTFLLILVRISVIIRFGFFWGDKRINKLPKVALILFISIIVHMSGSYQMIDITNNFVLLVINQVFIGFTIGFTSNLILRTISTASSIIDIQGGFGMAQIFDPGTMSQASVVSQLMITTSLLCAISNDLHISFLTLIIDSFNVINFTASFDPLSVVMIIIKCISIGICIALPVIGIVFMIDTLLGISAKSMPQLNLFSIGFIVKIFVTVILMYAYILSVNGFVTNISQYIFEFLYNL